MPAKKSAGASIIGRAVEHYKSQAVKRIEIPEWGDDDGALVVFCQPFTLRDQARIQQSTKGQPQAEALAEVVILKLVDENGEKVFSMDDKTKLRTQVDAQVLARVAGQIMGLNQEILEKN